MRTRPGCSRNHFLKYGRNRYLVVSYRLDLGATFGDYSELAAIPLAEPFPLLLI